MDTNKIIYWASTGIVTLIMLFSAYQYFFNHAAISEAFTHLGYPTYLIYPLATAKLMGLAAILSRISEFLKNLAYAGFFYNTLLAFTAHLMAGDGITLFSTLGVIAVCLSYFYERRIYNTEA